VTTSRLVEIPGEEARLRRKIRRHFKKLNFTKGCDGQLVPPGLDKQAYRDMHSHQRIAKLTENRIWIENNAGKLIHHFASGSEVNAKKILPRIEVIKASTWQSNLFRLASYYLRVPISEGYGRRMRFLVWDDSNEKLIGIFALGDAVFNLKARDEFIGWDHNRRSEALVNLMDAYVLGAVPPYNTILGGKLIASLIQTREVVNEFHSKYHDSVGLISGESKKARLAAVTTTSALGRSSVYNRLALEGKPIFIPIGYTSGWGHFHISNELFVELRNFLKSVGYDDFDSHDYGQGPNYRFRIVKKAFSILGMRPSLAKHGLNREVFFCPIATNALKLLRGESSKVSYSGLSTIKNRSRSALNRWVIPRTERMPLYRDWHRETFLSLVSLDENSGENVEAQGVAK